MTSHPHPRLVKGKKRKEKGRPAKDLSYEGMLTATAQKELVSKVEDEKEEETVRRVRDPSLRASYERSQDVRRRAEDMGYEMRMAPTADIAAQVHEGIEALMKVAEISKNFQSGLCKGL
jgi:hypothetical protein